MGPYIQSQRMGMFKGYAEELVKKGAAYYDCGTGAAGIAFLYKIS